MSPRLAARLRRSLSRRTPSRLRLPSFLLPLWAYFVARSATFRLILAASAAAGLAWTVSNQLDLRSTAMAAVAGCLTVQASVPSSLKEAGIRVLGTVAGMSVAVLASAAFGVTAWTAVLVVAASLVIGRLIGLGPEGSLTVPATSLFIFVLGSDLQPALVFDRMGATAVGVVVGIAASWFAHPSSPLERARGEVEALAFEIADLLSRIASALQGCSSAEAEALQEEASALDRRLEGASREVDAAVAASKFTGGPSPSLLPLLTSLDALSASCSQVRALSSTLVSAAASTADLPQELSEVLDAASEVFSAHAEAVASGDEDAVGEVQSRIEEVQSLREGAVESVRSMDDTGVWLLAGAVLTEVDRMVDEVESATAEAPEPVVPAPSVSLLSRLVQRRPRD